MSKFHGIQWPAGNLVLLLVGTCLLALTSHPVVTYAQDEPTATPDAEGIIYEVVRPNDSLWAIAGRANITLQELLALNSIDENTIIQPGQLLIIGIATPAPTPTVELPTPTPTATRPPPTPTQTPLPQPRTAICLKAFTDSDADGIHDPGEPFKTAVAFTVFNDQAVVRNYITDGVSEPYCLENLAPGEYQITRSVGRDEVLTTAGDWTLTLAAGTVLNLEFGSVNMEPGASVIGEPDSAPDGLPAKATPTPAPAAAGEQDALPTALLTAGAVMVLVLCLTGGILLTARIRRRESAD